MPAWVSATWTPMTGEAGRMLATGPMTGIANMPPPIAGLVALEVSEGLCSARGHRSNVAVMRVIPIVHVAIETVRAMKPGSRADEHAAHEPVRSIVAIWRTVIRCIVEIPVRTYRSRADVHDDLRMRRRHCRSRC